MKKIYPYIFIFSVILFACKKQLFITEYENYNIPLHDSLNLSHKPSAEIITPYRTNLQNEMQRIIGESAQNMITEKPQGLLGNFVADLLWYEFKDSVKNSTNCFSLINTRGLRAPLPQGKISVEKIFEIMPFDNEVVIAEYPGEKINELTSVLAKAGGHPVSQNIVFQYIDGICYNPYIDKKPFTNDTYYIITTDYLVEGGDNMSFFSYSSHIYKTGILLRDIIIKYIEKQNEKINSGIDERIIFK